MIALCNKDGAVRAYALIDAADAQWAGQWRWSLSTWGYAVRNVWRDGKNGGVRLHRELMGLVPGDGLEVDHRNRNKLDNRRENLLIVPKTVQAQNVPSRGGTSQHRGVSWDKARGKWIVRMRVHGGSYLYLGRFTSEEDAAEAARAARARLMPYATD